MERTKLKILPPRTVLRLITLWPHARKQGHGKGQIVRVGYYRKSCGTDIIWLVDNNGSYNWTGELSWVRKHFEIVELSRERSIYGKGRPKLTKLDKKEIKKYTNV